MRNFNQNEINLMKNLNQNLNQNPIKMNTFHTWTVFIVLSELLLTFVLKQKTITFSSLLPKMYDCFLVKILSFFDFLIFLIFSFFGFLIFWFFPFLIFLIFLIFWFFFWQWRYLTCIMGFHVQHRWAHKHHAVAGDCCGWGVVHVIGFEDDLGVGGHGNTIAVGQREHLQKKMKKMIKRRKNFWNSRLVGSILPCCHQARNSDFRSKWRQWGRPTPATRAHSSSPSRSVARGWRKSHPSSRSWPHQVAQTSSINQYLTWNKTQWCFSFFVNLWRRVVQPSWPSWLSWLILAKSWSESSSH